MQGQSRCHQVKKSHLPQCLTISSRCRAQHFGRWLPGKGGGSARPMPCGGPGWRAGPRAQRPARPHPLQPQWGSGSPPGRPSDVGALAALCRRPDGGGGRHTADGRLRPPRARRRRPQPRPSRLRRPPRSPGPSPGARRRSPARARRGRPGARARGEPHPCRRLARLTPQCPHGQRRLAMAPGLRPPQFLRARARRRRAGGPLGLGRRHCSLSLGPFRAGGTAPLGRAGPGRRVKGRSVPTPHLPSSSRER